MSTNFPSSLDTSTTVPAESASTPLSTNHVTAHQNIQDAIEAIEAKVGADSSATTTSHDYKLGEVTGSDKAVSKTASQTLTNKTLTSPVITSPTLNLGSDAEGDTYYRNSSGALVRLPRGTDNYIYKMNGNVPNWEVEATVSAATESAEGISRLATAAQITAGTATEGGYPLFVAPDQLALSAPTFSGANITSITRLLNTVTTDVTYSSSTAENNLLSYSVPANTLGTSNVIRVTLHIPTLAVTNTNNWTIRFKYGGTTIASKVYTPTGANASIAGKVEFILAASGATNTQNGSYFLNMGNSNFIGTTNAQVQMFSETAQGTSAIDSTSSQTLAITSQHSNSNALDNITVALITVEVLR